MKYNYLCVFSLLWLIAQFLLWAQPTDESLLAELRRRRSAVMTQMEPGSLLLLLSAPVRQRSGDVDYEYRQDNNLYYLTAMKQEETALVLLSGIEGHQGFLFVRNRAPEQEMWTGKILSVEEVRQRTGISQVYSYQDLEPFLDGLLRGHWRSYNLYVGPEQAKVFYDKRNMGAAIVYLLIEGGPGFKGEASTEWQFGQKLQAGFPGVTLRDCAPILHGLRQVKSSYEIGLLQRAIEITMEGQREAWMFTRPGLSEYEIEAVIEYIYKKNNSFDWAFPSIVAAGVNATTLHYTQSQGPLQEGDLLLLDVGAEYAHFSADLTRTIPISGTFTPAQREIYDLVWETQSSCIELVKPGRTIGEIHQHAVQKIQQGLLRLGLITEVNSPQYMLYFMHGTCHWLGMDTHDVGNRQSPFISGMVLTVEPGIYIAPDCLERARNRFGEAVARAIAPSVAKYQNIGVRIEDDVLVTPDGHQVLSQALPKSASEIEQRMREKSRIFGRE